MNPLLATDVKPSNRRTWGQRLMLLFNVGLITVSLMLAALLGYAGDRAGSINRVALDRSLTELPTAPPGQRVLNILLVGSDSSATLADDDPIQIGRQGERLGDVIIIAHLDERTGSVALLSLPRDLWVPIAGSDHESRINRAFFVGGPATLIDTIEENFDIPIHHYVNVDFAGFQGLVEAVGSVDVYFDSPARDWNVNAKPVPRSQTGFIVEEAGCHSLSPDQALAYVRSRYYQTQDEQGAWITDPTSDLGRIRRQQDFLQNLLQEAIDRGARNPLVLADLIDTGVHNVSIDHELTPSLLVDMSTTFRSFEPGDIQTFTFPVEDGTVGSNRVLLPSYADAEPLIELFNTATSDDPATVAISVVHPGALAFADGSPTRSSSLIGAVVDQLEDAEFVIASMEPADTTPGIVVYHGPDGLQGAELVAETLVASDAIGDELIRIELQDGLKGRSLVIAVGDSEPAASPLSPESQQGSEVGEFGVGVDATAEPKAVDDVIGSAPEQVDSGPIDHNEATSHSDPEPLGPGIAAGLTSESVSDAHVVERCE